jgi:esterase/lipase superfamily enzyme
MELDQKPSSTSEISALNTTKDEKQKENYAADQFFSSLLVLQIEGSRARGPSGGIDIEQMKGWASTLVANGPWYTNCRFPASE